MSDSNDNEVSVPRVLVVDDEKDIRDGCQRILTRLGCMVDTAESGEEGVKKLALFNPGIVLLDLKMPGMDGMETLKCIQEIDARVLIIIITGYATVETAIEAMKLGAYDFIPKPFEPDQLRIVVGRALEKKRLEAEAAKLQLDRQKTLVDLGTEKSRIRTVIESFPNGVMVTNSSGMVVLLNPAFMRMMELPPDRQTGEPVEAYVTDPGFCRLATDISKGVYSNTEDIPSYEFNPSPGRFLQARGRAVTGEEGECIGAVLVLMDVTSLKVLDRLKSEFVAKVSHELRSPLATIHEQLAVVMGDMVENASSEDTRILSRAKEKTQGLIELIGDLLDVSRIETGSAAHHAQRVPLSKLIPGLVDFLSSRAKAKEQSLVLNLPSEELPEILADPVALESVFSNLITNAVNYTPKGGRVEVSCRIEDGSLVADIKDNGYGIDKRHQEQIFEKFYRVKNENTRFITGTGLGLSIVKGILDALGGTISLESEPGKGSTFTVSIPLEGPRKSAD